MSVAFRRDGDEEHLEPRFEIPIPPGPNLVTARGLEMTRAKVTELEARLAGVDAGVDAGAGDEEEGKALRRDLKYWRTRQATARLMPVPDGALVEFGCTVTIMLNGKQRVLMLVGDDEADPAAGRIAFSAPLARAMMGAEEGDLLPFGGKQDAIEIVAIGPAE